MALDLTISNGIGDGDDSDSNSASFAGNPSGNVGQVLAADTTPTNIFQSELEGLTAATVIVLQATGNITTQSNLFFATNAGGGGGNISFVADFDGNGSGSYSGASTALNASGRIIRISGRTITTNTINTLTTSSVNGGAIALNSAGNISTASSLDSRSQVFTGNAGNGGAIALNSAGNINTTSLNSISFVSGNGNAGNGGAIALNSAGNISTSVLNSFSIVSSTGNAGNGGAITLNRAGNISTGSLDSRSQTSIGNAGNGGEIALNSAGNISTTGSLDSFSRVISNGNSVNGGAITLNSAGNISTSVLNSYSIVSSTGNAGNGGAIALNSSGNISTDFLFSYSQVSIGNAGNGGAIALNSTGNISTDFLSSFSGSSSGNAGNGGAITLNSSGNVTATTLQSYSLVSTGNAGNGGAIALNSAGNISTDFLSSFSGSSSGNAGNGGAIALNSAGNISTTDILQSISEVIVNGNAGNGGAIAFNGTNINITGAITTYSATGSGTVGNGGVVNLNATNSLNVSEINNFSTGTVNYGNIRLTGNEINLNAGPDTVRGNNRILTLQSSTPSQVIEIGSTDSGSASILDITATDLAAIADGFSQIAIGRSNGTGNININSNLNFSDPIFLLSPGGQININATVGLIDNTQLNFTASSPARLNTGGAIVLNANEQIANTADFNLNGGALTLGSFDETVDLLRLSANSSIDFGTGDSDIAFSDSSSQTWTGLLTIDNWSNASGETLRFGTNASGLTTAQLAQIQFTGFGVGAQIDSSGFVTPFVAPFVPEINVTDGGFGGGAADNILDGDLIISATDGTDFGTTTVGTTVIRTFTIENTGTAALTLTAPTLPTGFSLVGAFPTNIAAAGSSTFQVQLDAAGVGSPTGQISFANNDSDENPYNFAIAGVVNAVPVPEINVTDGGFGGGAADNILDGDLIISATDGTDFGTTTVGTTVIRTFTIENTGSAALTLTSPTLPAGFSLVGVFPTNIAAAGSSTFQVQLDAAAVGTPTGQISFANNDSDENPYNFAIAGVVNAVSVPEINVTDGGFGGGAADNILDGDLVISTADGTDFGTTTVGTTVIRTFTIENTGTAALTLTAPTLPTGFSLVGAFPTSIAAAGSSTFQVQLDAAAAGTPTGQISFANNDSDENPYNFAIAGVVNAVPVPEINVTDGGFGGGAADNILDGDLIISATDGTDFGTTTVGTTVIRTFTIENTGTAALTLTAPTLPSGFSLVGAFPTNIAAAGSSTFQVQLDATGVGSPTGQISFANNDSDENPYNFAIAGVVNAVPVPAGITIAPTSGLVTTEAGGTANFTVKLNSQPTANVTLNLSSSDPTEGYLSTSSLIFTAANFNIAQSVTVTGIDDLDVDGNISYTIVTAPAISTDLNYSGLNPSDVSVTNNDNDIALVPTPGTTVIPSGGGNLILGNNLANVIFGLTTNDTIYGYAGDDYITGQNGLDYIDGGIDNDTLLGGAGNDTLLGGAGNDTLIGGIGADSLIGGAEIDTFVYNAIAEGGDAIADFAATEKFLVSQGGFGGGLLPGLLLASQFGSGASLSAAANATQRFIYDTTSGILRFDADGNGVGASSIVATLTTKPALSNSNIQVF